MSGHKQNLSSLNIDGSWTLFLDRDGVINKKIDNDYVRDWGMFDFLPGVIKAIEMLSNIFGRIIIVSNQQGIGKGLMTKDDLEAVHGQMQSHIKKGGGRIDKIYFAPMLEQENHPWRKPGTGMAEAAKKDFPAIDFSKSIMVGDSESDINFGKAMGMFTVLIGDNEKEDVDAMLKCRSLLQFSELILNDSK